MLFRFQSSGVRTVTVLIGTGCGSNWIGKIIDVLGQFGKFYSHTINLKTVKKKYLIVLW